MELDLSKIVPSKEEREAFWALQQARDAADAAYNDAVGDLPDNDTYEDACTQLRRDRRDEKISYAEMSDKIGELAKIENARIDALPEIAALKAANDAAEKLWSDHPAESGVWTNYEDKPYRCAASGAVLLEDDEYLEDSETSEYVLRSLVMPPRPSEEDEAEDDAEEGEPKFVAA